VPLEAGGREGLRLGDVAAAHAHLAHLTVRQRRLALLREDCNLDVGPLAHRARLVRPAARQRVGGDLVGRLCHRIRLEHRSAKLLLERLQDRRRERGGAGPDEAHLRPARGRIAVQPFEQKLLHGRHRRVPGGAARRNVAPEDLDAEPGAVGRQDDLAARIEGREECRHEAVHLKENRANHKGDS